MDDLARGWATVMQHWHGHGQWAVWIALFVAVWLPIWAGVAEKKKNKKPEEQDFRPIRRTQIPGSEKDYRSEGTRLD